MPRSKLSKIQILLHWSNKLLYHHLHKLKSQPGNRGLLAVRLLFAYENVANIQHRQKYDINVFLEFQKLILHCIAVTTTIWIAPCNRRSICQDRSKCACALDLLHIPELILHCRAVSSIIWMAPCDYPVATTAPQSEGAAFATGTHLFCYCQLRLKYNSSEALFLSEPFTQQPQQRLPILCRVTQNAPICSDKPQESLLKRPLRRHLQVPNLGKLGFTWRATSTTWASWNNKYGSRTVSTCNLGSVNFHTRSSYVLHVVLYICIYIYIYIYMYVMDVFLLGQKRINYPQEFGPVFPKTCSRIWGDFPNDYVIGKQKMMLNHQPKTCINVLRMDVTRKLVLPVCW